MSKHFFFILVIVKALIFCPPLLADVIVDSPLSFGQIAVRSNADVSQVSITRNGVQHSTNHIYVLQPGSPAVITFTDFPPFTIVNLSVDLPAYSVMAFPNTAQFEMTAIDIQSSLNMGPTGSGQIRMGGTLSTSGNPAENYYSGAEYLIYLNLNIDY